MYLTEIFGSKVFNDDVMRQRLPAVTYKALNTTIKQNKRLDPEVANVVANAMKDWALENGATHFTTGSSLSTVSPRRSTTASSVPWAAAGSSTSSPAPT